MTRETCQNTCSISIKFMFVMVFSEKRVGLEALEASRIFVPQAQDKTLFRGHKSSLLKIKVLTTLHTKFSKVLHLSLSALIRQICENFFNNHQK